MLTAVLKAVKDAVTRTQGPCVAVPQRPATHGLIPVKCVLSNYLWFQAFAMSTALLQRTAVGIMRVWCFSPSEMKSAMDFLGNSIFFKNFLGVESNLGTHNLGLLSGNHYYRTQYYCNWSMSGQKSSQCANNFRSRTLDSLLEAAH
jgi:hypothetical protein